MARSSAAVLAVLATVGSASPSLSAGLRHFSVAQVRQIEEPATSVQAYLDLRDLDHRPVADLDSSNLTATLGEWTTEVVRVTPFSSLEQGIAYVFLVDISQSLSPDLFDQMVAGIETWIGDLGPRDRAAILAFGESTRLVSDFTDDREPLLASLAALQPTDDKTLLHQALMEGLDLCRRLDPDLPGRRAVIVFSDGKDEGSSYLAEDVLARLREESTPIYAIGYSGLRDPVEREEYLGLLQRFSTLSGGAFYAAERTRFAEAYDTIRELIGSVWVADFRCSDCRPDGRLHRLQVAVTLDGQSLSSGGSVRLLPVAAAGDEAPEAEAPVVTSPVVEPAAETAMNSGQSLWRRYWLEALALVLSSFLVWQWLWGRRERSVAGTPVETTSAEAEAPPVDPQAEILIDAEQPPPLPAEKSLQTPIPAPIPRRRPGTEAPPMQVRLIVVRGSRTGRQYSFIVEESAVVGRRSSCACVLAHEPGIDAEQFELRHQEGGLFIRNLSAQHPTLMSGGPIEGLVRLTSDTLIGTGETVLRIVFF